MVLDYINYTIKHLRETIYKYNFGCLNLIYCLILVGTDKDHLSKLSNYVSKNLQKNSSDSRETICQYEVSPSRNRIFGK